MKTVTIIAGNTDNKLTQQAWSKFITFLSHSIESNACGVEFSGGPATALPYQNFAWVIRIDSLPATQLRSEIESIRTTFHQEAVAWIEGTTQFI
jgi:hypothetical protein